jgi:hypothetical protein
MNSSPLQRKSSQNNMTAVCIKLRNKKISHNSIDDIIDNQLSAEGIKRVESFIFEISLKYHLQKTESKPDLHLSFGWSIGFNKQKTAAYWFRFQENENDWNEADQALTLRINDDAKRISPDISIHRITFNSDSNSFLSQTYINDHWSISDPIEKMLNKLPAKGPSRSIRDTDEEFFDEKRYRIASYWMRKNEFSEEIKKTSLHRRLINCIIVPALGRQIVDLDAVILTQNNSLQCLEFKRKYPSKNKKTFGLDTHPHIELIKTLSLFSIGMRHLILVSPNWDKDYSPLTMLEDNGSHKHWRWLAANLDSSSIGATQMKTDGKDSGHSGETRTQYNIKWEYLHVLHEGLRLGTEGKEKLLEFLASGNLSTLPTATFASLQQVRIKSPHQCTPK